MPLKKYFITALFFICISGFQNSYSQGIKFEKNQWKKILKKSNKEDKYIFVQLLSSSCFQCNEVADKAFANEDLGNYFNQRFVSVRLDGFAGEGLALAKKYSVSSLPASLFLDENGDILNIYIGSTTRTADYIKNAEIAFSRKNDISFADFEKEYQQGNRSLLFLKSYIIEREKMKMPVDSVLDQYAEKFPKNSSYSLDVINFIFDQAPVIDSKAYAIMRSNPSSFDKVFWAADSDKRLKFNNAVILKTRTKAVAEKNDSLAINAAIFAKETWGKDSIKGQKSFDYTMMEYYKGIKDTIKYVNTVKRYYQVYYMEKNFDSLKDAEQEAFKLAMQTVPGDTIRTDSGIIIRKKMITPSTNFEYGNSLNSGAWSMYEFASDSSDLQIAVAWIKRAINYLRSPAYYDTYAHLLFRLNHKEQAIEWQQKAVDMVNRAIIGTKNKRYEIELNKMKSDSL